MSEIEMKHLIPSMTPLLDLAEAPVRPAEKFVYEIPPSFDSVFSKFDDGLIGCLQYFHPKKKGILNKVIGYPLYGVSLIFTCIEEEFS